MSRPTKLTPTAADAVVAAVAAGLPRRFAARAAGVSPSALFAWLRRGRLRRGAAYVQFLDRVKKAEADAVAARLRLIDRAAEAGTWQAAAWRLERQHPEEFGRDREELRRLAKQIKELLATVGGLRAGGPAGDAP